MTRISGCLISMAETDSNPTAPLFRKLLLKLVIFHAASLLVFLALAMFIVNNSRAHQARQFSDAFRDLLVSGDTSQVIIGMSKPILNDFVGAEWRSERGTQNFSIPLDFKRPGPYFNIRIAVPVYFDEARRVEAGRMYFYYPRGAFLGWAGIAWGALVLLSIPLGLAERKRLSKEYNLLIQSNINESKAAMAAQVAHDIRSPLVALDAALDNTAALPEKQRAIVRHSLNRIRDVANSLLERNRAQLGTSNAFENDAGEPLETRLLSSLIGSVITEKRVQYGSKHGIEIDFRPTRESYGLFAAIQPVEFGRVLSNLVNNAVEALGDRGKVDVRLAEEGDRVILTIADDGKGISPEILAKLGKKGETHGKAGGSGLGLFHARTVVESWGGALAIASAPGKGATVTIRLPKAEPPAGFVGSLDLIPGSPVAVLDDDKGIHALWQKKLAPLALKERDIEALYFSEPEDLRAWAKAEPAKAKVALCLFDYELSGRNETGLTLAEELGLCPRTILVTGRSEEKRIIEACARLKVRSIPKPLLEFVPVKVGAPSMAVLIDDDPIVHMNWETAAEEAGVELKSYRSPAEFLADLESFSKETPVYIDSELGADIKGEDVAAALKEKGFTNLTLVTGYSPERFARLSWLKVRGKESPWRA